MSTLRRDSLTTAAVCAAAMMVVSTTWAKPKPNSDPNNCGGKAYVAYSNCTRYMSADYCTDIYNRTLNNCLSRTQTGGARAQDVAPPPTAPTTATPSTTLSTRTAPANTSLKSKSSAFSVHTSIASPVANSYPSVGVPTTAADTSHKSKNSAFTVQTGVATPVTNNYPSVGVAVAPKSTFPSPSASVHIASGVPVIAHNGQHGMPNGIAPTRHDGKR